MRIRSITLTTTLFAGLLLGTSAAHAAATVNQIPDKTFMYGQDFAAEMAFDDAAQRDPDYTYLGITGMNLSACTLTAFDGLYCLDGKIVRNWPNPSTTDYSPIVDCIDPALGLDTKKANTCTGMTVDPDGNIWLAGKNKGKSNSLIKLVAKDSSVTSCPEVPFAGATDLGVLAGNDSYCAVEVATGRPLLVDITPTDGVFDGQSAILGLEGGKTAVAFKADGEVVEIASGKSDWGLIGPEQLLGITLLQHDSAVSVQNIILVTTTRGRVLAWDMDGVGPAQEVFVVADPSEGTTFDRGSCSSADPVYSIRASNTTNLVYVTDSEYCEVIVLKATTTDPTTTDRGGEFTGLENAQESESGPNLTLSTWPLTTPIGITVAPGNTLDLGDCADECSLGTNEEGDPLATLVGVQLVDESVSGLSIYRIDGIPDCRYGVHDCPDAIVHLVDSGHDDYNSPEAQRLNIKPLLPTKITDLFPEGLPDLLLPRYIRAQEENDFLFGGLFGITQEGVVFRDTFDGRYFIEDSGLTSFSCKGYLDEDHDFLHWNIVASVSEHYFSARDSDSDPDIKPPHLASIISSGCGSSRTRDVRWSFKPYNLEPTPCTFNPDSDDIWRSDCGQGGVGEEHDDAVYAKMLLILADEYDRTLNQLACFDSDGNGVPPLTVDDCADLQDQVVNMVDKLHKCWDATMQPKQSSGDQNCQAFDSQLAELQILLDGISPVGTDVANRVGELKARAATMRHVFETRFMPSLPEGGFLGETQP